MPDSKKRYPIMSLLWVLGGLFFLYCAINIDSSHRSATKFPVDLGIATTHSGVFKAPTSAQYEIVLDLKRHLTPSLNLSDDKMGCLVGASLPKPEICRGMHSKLSLKWILQSTDGIVIQGVSQDAHGTGWGSTLQKTIGTAPLIGGRRYSLTIVSESELSELMPATPTIYVQLSDIETKGDVVAVLLFLIFAILMGAIGLAGLIAWKIKTRRCS